MNNKESTNNSNKSKKNALRIVAIVLAVPIFAYAVFSFINKEDRSPLTWLISLALLYISLVLGSYGIKKSGKRDIDESKTDSSTQQRINQKISEERWTYKR